MCLSLRCTGLSGSAAAFTLKVLATPPTDHHYRDLCHPEFRIWSSIYIPIFESYFGGWGGVRGPTSGVLGNYSWRFLFTCCTNKCIPRSFRGAGGSSILPGCKPPLSASLRGRPPSPQYSTIGCERNMERGVYRFFGVFFPPLSLRAVHVLQQVWLIVRAGVVFSLLPFCPLSQQVGYCFASMQATQ